MDDARRDLLLLLSETLRDNAALEADARRSEERYRCLVEASAQLVWSCDASGAMTGRQPGWAAFTGQAEAEYAGMGWLTAVHPDDRPRVASRWNEAASARAVFRADFRLRRADGEVVWVEARAVPVRASDGAVREWIGVGTDLSERVRLLEAADRARRAVEAVVESVIAQTRLSPFDR